MSVVWTLLGTFAQVMLGMLMFMGVVFSASAFGNNASLSKFQVGVLTSFIYLLPALCALSALIVIYLHWRGGSATSYWWYAMPFAGPLIYLGYIFTISRYVDPNG
jgi:hypothetical protein